MRNLIAYIPVLNQRHIDWFKKNPVDLLYLVPKEMAESLLPRLARNMSAVSADVVLKSIEANRLVRSIAIFNPESGDPNESRGFGTWVLPDEDISRLIAEKYLSPSGVPYEFEMIWARWDMSTVHKEQPIIADVQVSSDALENIRMKLAEDESLRSPDWWRQIGAVAFDADGARLFVAHNTHMPNEYETYVFGDPRLNVDAGQKGKYVSLHAERAVIALCAKYGFPLSGASMYVTTFPCEDCAREIAYAGVKKLFFREGYSVLNAQEVLRSRGVQIVQVVKDPESA